MKIQEFSHYDDSSKALNIWNSYREELYARDLVNKGEAVVRECREVSKLEVKLDSLISRAHDRLIARPSSFPVESDPGETNAGYAFTHLDQD